MASAIDEQSCNHKTLRLRADDSVFRSLEGLVRIGRETVEVEAIIPIGSSDKRQPVRSEVVDDMVKTDTKVLHKRHFCSGHILPWYGFVQDGEVSGLTDIGSSTEDEPHRVIVKSSSYIIIAAFGERLVLVVATSIGELGCSDVEDTLPCTRRDLVYKANEVLVRVPETHSAAYTALEEGSGPAHAEGDHTLVLVPYIHHPVEPLIRALYLELTEQFVPQGIELSKSSFDRLHGSKPADNFVRAYLINNVKIACTERGYLSIGGCKLLLLRILLITEYEDQVAGLTGSEGHFYVVRSDRTPSMCHAISRPAIQYRLRFA